MATRNPLSYSYLLLILLLFIGCQYSRPSKPIYVKDSVLYFNSSITDDSVNHALQLIAQSDSIDTVTVSSRGGEVNSALRFGHWIHDNKIALVVDEACFSSCANYWLTSSPDIVVKKGAVIGWHGGALQDISLTDMSNWSEEKIKSHLAWRQDWKKKETALFKKNGVDQRITIFGQLNDSALLKENPACDESNRKGWTYSYETLKKLGIKKIRFEDTTPSLKMRYGSLTVCIIEPLID